MNPEWRAMLDTVYEPLVFLYSTCLALARVDPILFLQLWSQAISANPLQYGKEESFSCTINKLSSWALAPLGASLRAQRCYLKVLGFNEADFDRWMTGNRIHSSLLPPRESVLRWSLWWHHAQPSNQLCLIPSSGQVAYAQPHLFSSFFSAIPLLSPPFPNKGEACEFLLLGSVSWNLS